MISIVILTMLLVIAAIAWFRGSRKLKIIAAISIFLYQFYILALAFDFEARVQAGKRISEGLMTDDFDKGMRTLSVALTPYRILLLVSSVGFLVLVVGRSKKPKDKVDA